MRGQETSRSNLGPRSRGGQFGEVYRPENFAGLTTPSAALRLRIFFLVPQPPLLSQEGNFARFQFIHSFYDREQLIRGKTRGHRPRLQKSS